MNPAIAQIRHRRPPRGDRPIYGVYAPRMQKGTKFFSDMVDRAAYMYVTGCFPSHLRSTYTDVLRVISGPCRWPPSLDRRFGERKLRDEVVADMQLEQHAMVAAVRRKIGQGYLIQHSLGFGTRRNYWKIFMFRPTSDGRIAFKVTVQGDGAEKQGW